MRIYKYTIHNQSEETECAGCGYPMFTGDSAVMDDDRAEAFCSKSCIRRMDQAEAQWTANREARS